MYAVFYHSGQYSVALTGLRAAGHIIDWHGHIPCPSVQSVAVTESGGTLLERIERTPSKETWVWEDATRKAFDEPGPMLARWLDEGNRVAILGVDNAERFTLAVTQTATAFLQGAVLWAVSDDEAMKETMLAHHKAGQPHSAVAECCNEVLKRADENTALAFDMVKEFKIPTVEYCERLIAARDAAAEAADNVSLTPKGNIVAMTQAAAAMSQDVSTEDVSVELEGLNLAAGGTGAEVKPYHISIEYFFGSGNAEDVLTLPELLRRMPQDASDSSNLGTWYATNGDAEDPDFDLVTVEALSPTYARVRAPWTTWGHRVVDMGSQVGGDLRRHAHTIRELALIHAMAPREYFLEPPRPNDLVMWSTNARSWLDLLELELALRRFCVAERAQQSGLGLEAPVLVFLGDKAAHDVAVIERGTGPVRLDFAHTVRQDALIMPLGAKGAHSNATGQATWSSRRSLAEELHELEQANLCLVFVHQPLTSHRPPKYCIVTPKQKKMFRRALEKNPSRLTGNPNEQITLVYSRLIEQDLIFKDIDPAARELALAFRNFSQRNNLLDLYRATGGVDDPRGVNVAAKAQVTLSMALNGFGLVAPTYAGKAQILAFNYEDADDAGPKFVRFATYATSLKGRDGASFDPEDPETWKIVNCVNAVEAHKGFFAPNALHVQSTDVWVHCLLTKDDNRNACTAVATFAATTHYLASLKHSILEGAKSLEVNRVAFSLFYVNNFSSKAEISFSYTHALDPDNLTPPTAAQILRLQATISPSTDGTNLGEAGRALWRLFKHVVNGYPSRAFDANPSMAGDDGKKWLPQPRRKRGANFGTI